MGQWTKHFIDGNTYTGSDEDVAKQQASWTRSRSSGIAAVTLNHNQQQLAIFGAGEYWQSDDFEVSYPDSGPKMVRRRICRKIDPTDLYYSVYTNPSSLEVVFNEGTNLQERRGRISRIDPSMYGKWLVLELDLPTYHTRCQIRSSRA